MKKSFALALMAFLAFVFISCTYEGDTYIINQEKERESFSVTIAELETRTVVGRKKDKDGNFIDEIPGEGNYLTLGFMDGKEDIPFVIFDDICLEHELYETSPVNADTKIVTIKNKKYGGCFTANLSERTLTFDNLDAFFQTSDSYIDPSSSYYSEYITLTSYKNIAGSPLQIDLNKYNIPMIIAKTEKGYFLALPYQTFNDILLSASCNSLLFNGKNFYDCSGLLSYSYEDYFENAPKKESLTRSPELTDFCYRELCLNLDFNYGLKEIHGIDFFQDFDSYFTATGFKEDLQKQDSVVFTKALANFISYCLNEQHSVYGAQSFYVPRGINIEANFVSESKKKWNRNNELYSLARNPNYKEQGSKCFETSEDGKTVIVRFDEFTCNHYNKDTIENAARLLEENYLDEYAGCSLLENYIDTPVLIHVLNEKIKAHDSEIENVVLDLSCNRGGMNVAAIYVIAWMLGECTSDTQNTISGARCSTTFKADVNLDGVFGSEEDTICDKNLFCLISPVSFSNGSIVPAVLKESGRVTLLGQSSSGGASTVHLSCTADGTIFSISSKYVNCIEKNGSYYDVDRGVTPHYPINNPEHFYDVEKISSLVNSINGEE